MGRCRSSRPSRSRRSRRSGPRCTDPSPTPSPSPTPPGTRRGCATAAPTPSPCSSPSVSPAAGMATLPFWVCSPSCRGCGAALPRRPRPQRPLRRARRAGAGGGCGGRARRVAHGGSGVGVRSLGPSRHRTPPPRLDRRRQAVRMELRGRSRKRSRRPSSCLRPGRSTYPPSRRSTATSSVASCATSNGRARSGSCQRRRPGRWRTPSRGCSR